MTGPSFPLALPPEPLRPPPGADRPDAADMVRFAVDVARKAGREIIMPRLRFGAKGRTEVAYKGVRDLVTEADTLSERFIVSKIRERYPDHGILAEEETEVEGAGSSPWKWIVDPLDGTTNFAHGHPMFAVSIACAGPDGVEIGAVFAPYLDEMFFGSRGGGAFLNSETIRLGVSDEGELIRSLLATGFAYNQERFSNLATFNRILPRVQGVRRAGSAALDLCYVAAGRLEGFWEPGLNPYDVAAGALLVREAGGNVTDYRGDADGWLYGRNIVATNGRVHGPLQAEIHDAL